MCLVHGWEGLLGVGRRYCSIELLEWSNTSPHNITCHPYPPWWQWHCLHYVLRRSPDYLVSRHARVRHLLADSGVVTALVCDHVRMWGTLLPNCHSHPTRTGHSRLVEVLPSCHHFILSSSSPTSTGVPSSKVHGSLWIRHSIRNHPCRSQPNSIGMH